ncbi:MAG: uracil-DNA glycosylase [Spirochaetia bacterium]|nr:uracil-DNA glycosylase [Spirochaetia bacterium]
MDNNEQSKKLDNLKKGVLLCERCKLSTTRTNVVFGEGSSEAEIMFIGEGPGKTEDLTGRPFVGRAGALLTSIIENGMKLKRENVYIANIVKCRPSVDYKMQKDRPPDKEELKCCSPFLTEQIKIINPKVIIALGSPSSKFLLNSNIGITKLRGNWGSFLKIPVMPTYHPSYVLRNGGEKSPLKKDVWEDIKKVLKKLNV